MDFDFDKLASTNVQNIATSNPPKKEMQEEPLIVNLDSSSDDEGFEYKANPIQHPKPISDEFEHVDPSVISKETPKSGSASEKINTDEDLLGNLEGESNLLSSYGKMSDRVVDFLSSERGGSPIVSPKTVTEELKAPKQEEVKVLEQEEEKNNDMFFDDSPSPSPAKKSQISNLVEPEDKFISSEDLLSDFKYEKKDSAPAATPQIQSEPEVFKPTLVSSIIKEKLVEEPKKPSTPPATAPPAVTSGVETLSKPLPTQQPQTLKAKDEDVSIILVEQVFCNYGLDIWFTPERLHPIVESLIYWRDIKKSGIVFGTGLVALLAVSCCSVISVLAYLSLAALTGAIVFRIYKTIMAAIHKTSEGHPFKEYLEIDMTLSQDKVQEICSVSVAHLNGFTTELRRLFLVEDLIDSLKFGGILWILTYIGAWFNGMTLVIFAYVALFTLPKVYENNKQSIDAYLELVHTKISEITDKVRTAIPIGKTAPVESDKDK